MFRDGRGRTLTTVELRDAAERVAAGLGVQRGDVVSWQLPTVLESVVVARCAGTDRRRAEPVIPILAGTRSTTHHRHHRYPAVGGPRGVAGLLPRRHGRRIGERLGFEVVTLPLRWSRPGPTCVSRSGDPSDLAPPPTTGDECRWIYFTSGTTAAPKGVRHTDASVIASSFGITDGLGIRVGDVYPIAWPFTHIGGITMASAVLRAGGELVLFDTFDPETTGDLMAAVRSDDPGHGCARSFVPTCRRSGVTDAHRSTRLCAPLPPEALQPLPRSSRSSRRSSGWTSSSTPGVSPSSLSRPARRPPIPPTSWRCTVGRPSPHVDIRVVDGELRLKGPQCFLGYVDASLDAAAFDDEGWLRTGDLGEVDSEGFVTITGRLKDVIIRNGENISAVELEDVLLRHPDIVDVAVLGLPDARTGERVCAVVVPAPGSQARPGHDRRALQRRGHRPPEDARTARSRRPDRPQPDGKGRQAEPAGTSIFQGPRQPVGDWTVALVLDSPPPPLRSRRFT